MLLKHAAYVVHVCICTYCGAFDCPVAAMKCATCASGGMSDWAGPAVIHCGSSPLADVDLGAARGILLAAVLTSLVCCGTYFEAVTVNSIVSLCAVSLAVAVTVTAPTLVKLRNTASVEALAATACCLCLHGRCWVAHCFIKQS